MMRRVAIWLRLCWYLPLLTGWAVLSSRSVINADADRWASIVKWPYKNLPRRLYLLATYPEFRTLYYYRLRRSSNFGVAVAVILRVVYPGERTLFLGCPDIGPGLYIQHGFATIIAARKLGANCWINQQVTIGFVSPGARPTIGDNVAIHAGAKVLGEIMVGDGARIGANAVVLEDVPPGHTAVGVPARMLAPKAKSD